MPQLKRRLKDEYPNPAFDPDKKEDALPGTKEADSRLNDPMLKHSWHPMQGPDTSERSSPLGTFQFQTPEDRELAKLLFGDRFSPQAGDIELKPGSASRRRLPATSSSEADALYQHFLAAQNK